MQDIRLIDKDTLDTLRICYLHAQLKMKYQEIADYMDVSTATVGRKIQIGKKAGWLQERIAFTPPEDFEDLDDAYFIRPKQDLEKEIYGRFSNEFDECDRITVVPSGLDYVVAATARLLERKLTADNILGVNWGTTTYKIAMELDPSRPNPDLTCVPVFGNLGLPAIKEEIGHVRSPTYESTLAYESSGIAHLIAQKFGGSQPVKLSFQAFMPEQFADEQSVHGKVIREYLKCDSSYQKVFGEGGLADQLDTLISGIGALEEGSAWFRFTENIHNRDPKPIFDELKRVGVVGDIGQFFVTREGFSSDAGSATAAINKQVIGLNLERHFVGLVNRHRKGPRKGAGLVIAAAGESKAPITIAAIRTGLNHLVIDEDLAEAIIALDK